MGTAGPVNPTASANDATVGTIAWTSPLNVLADDAASADAVMLVTQVSQYVLATGFQFAIPLDATVLGIAVDIKRVATLLSGAQDATLKLAKAGVPVGTNAANASAWPTSAAYQGYGSASDLWGTTWTPAEINASGFGVALSASALLGVTASVEHIRVTVTYLGSNRTRSAHGRVSSLASELH